MRNGFSILDAHCHVYPEKIASKAAGATNGFYGIDLAPCEGTVSDLMRLGQAAGVDRYLIQSVATTPKQVASIHTFIANEVAQDPASLAGLGTFHPDCDDIAGVVEQILSLGLHGVKIHPDIQRFAVDDPRAMKFYELCEGRLPILIHTGDRRYDFSNPDRLSRVLDAFPKLAVIGAHFGGWSIWEEASRLLAGRENLWVDCSSTFYAVPENKKVEEMISRYGADRVLFGTDYPMWRPDTELDRFFTLDLSDEARHLILSENAKRVYGIE